MTMAMKRSDLKKLGKIQLYTLRTRGCPKQIIEILEKKLPTVVEKALTMTIPDNHLAILPVIKPVYLGYYGLMAMVRNYQAEGRVCLNPSKITDKISVLDDLYWLYDVENGSSTCGKSPEAAEKIFNQQKRSPLTTAEVIALPTHTEVLSKHYVWAPGSRFVSAALVPYVCLGLGGRPLLDWGYVDHSDDRWGSASCGSR